MKILLGVVSAISLFFCSALPVGAKIIITEVYSSPASGQSEWFELYNDSPDVASLSNWSAFDQLASPSLIYSFDKESDLFLAPFEYKVFTLSTAKLNNTADGITLVNACEEVVDSMQYVQSSTNAQSWSLLSNTWQINSPTPGSANTPPLPSPTPSITPSPSTSPTPTPTPTPSATATPSPSPVVISDSFVRDNLSLVEVLACPEVGQKEWLRLNWQGTTSTLHNWTFADSTATIYTFYNFTLNPGEFTIELPSARLNNTGDSLVLVSPTGEEIWQYDLPKCSPGETFKPQKAPVTTTSTSSTTLATTSGQIQATAAPLQPSSAPVNSSTKATTSQPYQGKIPLLSFPSSSLLTSPSKTVSEPLKNPTLYAISAILGGSIVLLLSSFYLYRYVEKNGYLDFSSHFD